jgi:predicted flap endonuclease-1-like 5' DNA nuclease
LDEEEAKPAKKAEKAAGGEDLTEIDGVSESIAESLAEAGYDTKAKIAATTAADLTKIKGIGKVTAQKIIDGAQ